MKDLKTLVDKYLDGTTSNEEEQRLRDYFSSPTVLVPEDMEWMRALFVYETNVVEHADDTATLRPKNRHRCLGWAAAAIALMVVGVGITYYQNSQQPQDYALIDGQMVNNRQQVIEEALSALDMVSQTDEETYEALFE